MTAQIEKVAYSLAERAVERKYMGKQAQGFKLPRAAQTALIGSLLGGAGTGLVSALSGRRRGALVRDLLLGTLVGGAGGAAYPYITETAEEIGKKIFGPELTPEQISAKRQQDVIETIRGVGKPGVVGAGIRGLGDIGVGTTRALYGTGSGADILSYGLPVATGAGVAGLSHAREMAQANKLFNEMPKGLSRLKRGTLRGLRVLPGGKSLGWGLATALLTAAIERYKRMPRGATQ